MMERVTERGAKAAEQRVKTRTAEIAGRIGEMLPPGVEAQAEEGCVRLSGRGLLRRLVTEARLRWLLARVR